MIIHIDQQIDIDDLLEELSFARVAIYGNAMGDCRLYVVVIDLEEVYRLLNKYFPQIQKHIHGTAGITETNKNM